MNKIDLFGLDFVNANQDMVMSEIFDYLNSGQNLHRVIFTPNPEMIVEFHKDPEFFNVLKSAWMKLPDGFGLLLASKFLGLGKFASRITGTDTMIKFLEKNKDHKVFLLGGEPGVAEIVEEKFPDSNIVGFSGASYEDSGVVDEINESGAEVLFVAFGAPKQEKWLYRNMFKLNSVRLAFGVGGAFDFIAGKQKRAPKSMRALGLEWLWRLFKQPKRIGRILNAVLKFPWLVLKKKLRN